MRIERGPDGSIEEILAQYIDRLNRGEEITPEEVLFDHLIDGPEILDQIQTFIGPTADTERRTTSTRLRTLGDYTLRGQIGRGGMGVVYEAWQGSMDRVVALKVLPPGVAADDRAFQRFMQEAKTAGKLDHQNVVKVHAAGFDENTPYYSMEYVEGETLAKILARLKDVETETETPFGPKDEVDYFAKLARAFADVADGLQHAHSKGVTHRDIKPSNLILDNGGRLRILDFGLARLEGQESLTISGDVVGTPLYMSPEQARRKKIPVDHRTDVYSLGATMYEAICGRPPFRGKDHADTLSQIVERDPIEPRKVNPRVPKDLETIVLKCLRKDSGDRYGTAEALGQDLRRFLRGDPIEARPQLLWERVAARVRRNGVRLIATLAFVALAGTMTVIYLNGEIAGRRARLDRYEPAIREALALFGTGRFAAENLPNAAHRLIKEGGDLFSPFESGDFSMYFAAPASLERAREILERAAADVPDRPEAHYFLAQVFTALGDVESAKENARFALRSDPEFVPAYWTLAELEPEGTRGRSTAAAGLERFDGTGVWQEHWLRAERARREGEWDLAARSFADLIALGRERAPYAGWLAEAYLGRGTAYFEIGRFVEAQEDFIRAADRHAGIEPHLRLAAAYRVTAQPDEADRVLELVHARADDEEKVDVVLAIVALCGALNEYRLGLDWLERAGEIPARDRLMSYLEYRSGSFERAIVAARRAIERDPADVKARLLLTSIFLSDLQRGDGARRSWKASELVDVAREAAERSESRFGQMYLAAARKALEREAESLPGGTNMKNPSALPLIWIVASGVAAGAELFDDFEDGELLDGSPVVWEAGCPWNRNEWRIQDGELLLQNATQTNAWLPTVEVLEGDVTLETELRFVGTGGEVRLGLHSFCFPVQAYLAGLNREGEVRFNRWVDNVNAQGLAVAALPYDYDPGAWHRLRFDRIGSRLELRVWPTGEDMPKEPHLRLDDGELQRGQISLGFLKGSDDDWVAFRWVRVTTPTGPLFLRGDCNDDGTIDISDAQYLLNVLFLGGPRPPCDDAADTNDDGAADIADAQYLLNHLFLGGPPPPPPFAEQGEDPTEDALACRSS